MPLYEVEHIIHLSPLQLDKLAAGITRIHTLAFTTPSLFVNVRFTNVAQQVTYVGGKPKRANRIIAHIRNGGGRSSEQLERMCRELTEEWDKVIEHEGPEYKLRAIFMLGTITTAMEAGFVIPQAGDDVKWMKAHRHEFQQLAGEKESEGDPEFKELMREMQERDDLKRELGDQPETSGTRTGVPEHSHEPQTETSHDGHTPNHFAKIAERDSETPTEGVVNETSQRDTTTKLADAHHRAHQERDGSQEGGLSQHGGLSQQGAVPQQGQSFSPGDQSAQEGEILQDHPYLKYYIHDLDTPGARSQPTNTQPSSQAQTGKYEQLGSQSTQGPQYSQDIPTAGAHQYEHRGGQPAQQDSQYQRDGQSSQGTQSEQQSAGFEREGGLQHQHQHGQGGGDGPEIGHTSQDRTMGRQSGAAETAQAQALFADTDGPSDRGTPGPFTGA